MFNTTRTEKDEVIYKFAPGERALIRRHRNSASTRTPSWADLKECEVLRYNKRSVAVKIDGYGDKVYYADAKDLVPTISAMKKELEECDKRLAEMEAMGME